MIKKSNQKISIAHGMSLMGILLLCLVLSACAESENEPSIVISGGHGVDVGMTVELAVATENGVDTSYQWESIDPSIATISDEGVAKGIAAGETEIRATGAQTEASATHLIVVIARDSSPPTASDDPIIAEIETKWAGSAHADSTAEAFTHWNEEGVIPTSCARCHSSGGYIDFLGGDGTAPGSVEKEVSVGSLVDCETCHHPAASAISEVTFPSEVTIATAEPSARCMVCHQGRSSTDSVNESIATAAVSSSDEVSDDLSFENIHYYPAAATLFAGTVRGGYQYEGQVYDTRFRHVPGFNGCADCHDPHSTRVRFEKCQDCHAGVENVEDAHSIRMIASRNQDYDGDGNLSEGIHEEIVGLRNLLLTGIQRYGKEQGRAICYETNSYPYWFIDTNGDDQCSEDEATFLNGYNQWTARLVRATYNFQMASKDPGGFAHNAKYIIQLLFDSITDLNSALTVKLNTSKLVRTDFGHFNGASDAARHWDEDESVSASCSRCHGGADGFRFHAKYGVGLEVLETSNGLECSTCHENFGDTFDVLALNETSFPSGETLDLPGNDNLCSSCHSGRAAKATIDAAVAKGGRLRFQNVHYLAAASVLNGTDAKVGYEYDGKTYASRLSHTGGSQCTTCHNPTQSNHTFKIADVWEARCALCHGDETSAEEVRNVHTDDYDGDANTTESLKAEIEGMAAKLLAAMHTVSSGSGDAICYSSGSYPYFFVDSNDSGGVCDPSEATFSNGFSTWTAPLLKAAHNFQLSQTEHGAWAHNFDYIGQLVYDSVFDLTASNEGMTRP